MVEEQTHFRDHVVSRDDETTEEIIRGIVLELRHGGLRTSQDDWLTQVAHHKAQRRARIGQTISPMQNHKRIKQLVITLDSSRDFAPSLSVDTGTVEQRGELEGRETNAAGMLGRRSTQCLEHLGVSITDNDGEPFDR